MLNKKYFLILLLLIVGIFAISAVSAADNATDAMATDDANADEINTGVADDLEKSEEAADEINTGVVDDLEKSEEAADELDAGVVDDLEKSEEVADEVKLTKSQVDSQLTVDGSKESLSYINGNWYKIKLNDVYVINSFEEGKITYYREPCPIEKNSKEAYHYFISVFDNKMNIVYKKEIKNKPDYVRKNGNPTHDISKNSIPPGRYVLKFINCDDGKVMDTAVLIVKGDAKITASDFNGFYKDNSKMTITLTDKKTRKPLTAVKIKVVFSKGKTQITKYFMPDSKGKVSFVHNLGVGIWSVKITPVDSFVTGQAIKIAVVKKSGLSIKAQKVIEYKGHKVKLKAILKTRGKNVNEGKVVFNINGKNYYAYVKNGIATREVNLYKVKVYKYTARYLGSANLYKSGVSKSNAILKKSYATKIYPEDYKIWAFKNLKFKIWGDDGQKMKTGKLKVKMGKTFWIKVYNGKATFKLKKLVKNAYYSKRGKLKVTYIPESHKYHSSSKKFKLKG